MYLTFDRKTKELINYSSTSNADKPIIDPLYNKYNIVTFDEYTITVKRDEIDFIEVTKEEGNPLEYIVPGQYMLGDAENNHADVIGYMNEALAKGSRQIKKKLKIRKDVLPVSYAIFMGQLALKNESEYSPLEKEIVFHLGKDEYVFLFNKLMKMFNSIELIGGNFNKNVKLATTKEEIDEAYKELKLSLDKL